MVDPIPSPLSIGVGGRRLRYPIFCQLRGGLRYPIPYLRYPIGPKIVPTTPFSLFLALKVFLQHRKSIFLHEKHLEKPGSCKNFPIFPQKIGYLPGPKKYGGVKVCDWLPKGRQRVCKPPPTPMPFAPLRFSTSIDYRIF